MDQETGQLVARLWADSDGVPCDQCYLYGASRGTESSRHPHTSIVDVRDRLAADPGDQSALEE